MTEVSIFVISAGRPGNVAPMLAHLDGLEHTWIVPGPDATAYAKAGAGRIITDPGSLVGARNLALEMAALRDAWCIQVSDDLVGIKALDDGGAVPIPLPRAIDEMLGAAAMVGARLAGCSPTANAYWAKVRTHQSAFIVGDLIAVSPASPLRFDPSLRLKEDYDFTLQHLDRFGTVARCDWLLPHFRHRSNPGGAVAYRSALMEQESIEYLMTRWPGCIRPHPTRENEVRLRWPPA